jgi:hypothetical protein
MAPPELASGSDPSRVGIEQTQPLADDAFEYDLPIFALGSPFGDDLSSSAVAGDDTDISFNEQTATDLDDFTFDPVDFHNWLHDLQNPLGHNPSAPIYLPLEATGVHETGNIAPSVVSSETVQTSDAPHGSPTAPQNEGNDPGAVLAQRIEPPHTAVAFGMNVASQDGPSDSSTNGSHDDGIERHQLSKSHTVETSQPIDSCLAPADTRSESIGHEWKTVSRKALLPGCAVYAPNDRKRPRENTPPTEQAPARVPKTRKKAGDVCARCKLYREKVSKA